MCVSLCVRACVRARARACACVCEGHDELAAGPVIVEADYSVGRADGAPVDPPARARERGNERDRRAARTKGTGPLASPSRCARERETMRGRRKSGGGAAAHERRGASRASRSARPARAPCGLAGSRPGSGAPHARETVRGTSERENRRHGMRGAREAASAARPRGRLAGTRLGTVALHARTAGSLLDLAQWAQVRLKL